MCAAFLNWGRATWVIMAEAAAPKLADVERFADDERIWLDAFRALDPKQREAVLKVSGYETTFAASA